MASSHLTPLGPRKLGGKWLGRWSRPSGWGHVSLFLKTMEKPYQPENHGLVYNWLVVWNMFYILSIQLGIVSPADFHIFQRG